MVQEVDSEDALPQVWAVNLSRDVGDSSAGDAVAGLPLAADPPSEFVEHEVNHVSSLQPSPAQVIDPMLSLAVLTSLLTLHGESSFQFEVQGGQEAERPLGRGAHGGPGSSRSPVQRRSLFWESQGRQGLQGQCDRSQPVCCLDRVRDLQVAPQLRPKDGMPWHPPEECSFGEGCRVPLQGDSRGRRVLSVQPRDLPHGSRELGYAKVGALEATSPRATWEQGISRQDVCDPTEERGPSRQDLRDPAEEPGPSRQDLRDPAEEPGEDGGRSGDLANSQGVPRESIQCVKSSFGAHGDCRSRRSPKTSQSQGVSAERGDPRGLGEGPLDGAGQPELFFTALANADEVETCAYHLLRQEQYSYSDMESIIALMIPKSTSPTRTLSSPGRKRSFSLVFGLYAHGSYFGCTRDTRQYPQVCRYFNECLRRLAPESSSRWTSFTVLVNMKGAMHLDAHNLRNTHNLAVGLGSYSGGELWVERRDGDEFDPHTSVSWKEIPGGGRAPGQPVDTRHRPLSFSPKRYHQTLPWVGTRYAIVAYTARSLPEALLDVDLVRDLRQHRFPLPSSPTYERVLYEEEEEDQTGKDLFDYHEQMTPAEREAVLSIYQNFEEGLGEILALYPTTKNTKVVNLCTPWHRPVEIERSFQDADWTYAMLSHREGCDLTTNMGFQQAREKLQELQPEWLWCHVPQGPPVIFEKDEPWVDIREQSKARRYLKVVRHLLLLSRDHLARNGKLVWLAPEASQVWTVTEVTKFWKCHGHAAPLKPVDGVTLASNVEEIRDLSTSTSSSGLWEAMIESTKGAATWLMNDEGEHPIYPVDTSCLETLTTTELEKLYSHVRQLHRRFGHPSNRLLVKNLIHRNADEKVIAAASKLECDECLESQIKMPSPAVNLDKCDKLWSCLQADGFHLRCGTQVYHFLLMVDEASGFAVIREMFSHPEEEHRNMTGPEVVQALQEAWFQYFGYPDTMKLDLEGALRSTVLREACLDKGIDLVSAPAEYHETIADVEREIGYVRQHLETFLRGGTYENPGQAALAAVTAHNSLGRVHGFSPMQWALGRDMSMGGRLHEGDGDAISAARSTTFGQQSNLRLEAEQAFVKHRAHQLASRAKNAKVRTQVRFFPGDLVFFRRYKVPADLPANSWVDRPRLRGARWYGPARVLACETKVEPGSRKPSQVVWAIAGGRLKKFHVSQLRSASPGEKITHEALRDVTMPWTMTSLTRLLDKGSYEDETRAKASRWVPPGRKKKGASKRAPSLPPPLRVPREEPRGDRAPLRDPAPALGEAQDGSDEEMLTEAEMRRRMKRHLPEEEEDRIDVDRLLSDPRYLPRPAASSFREQRQQHEQSDRPWHVQVGQLMFSEAEVNDGVYSVVLDIPANDKEWRRVLKDPKKFLAKSVQKGVEVSWNRLDESQRKAMSEAKEAEVSSWLSNRVVKAALPHVTADQALKMRWIYTFKAAEPGKVKAKARMVILGFSDPSLLEQETAAPAMSRQSKMLFFNYAAAKRWRVLAGDVKTAFLQARAPDRKHPLFARPLPELAAAMGLPPEQMVELMGSAYGLTSAPREWYHDLTGTLRRLEAEPCVTDPCLWRLFSADGKQVIALVGLYVDDILFCGDETDERYSAFLHELHGAYAWSPWEADSFSHCGVRIQQFADGSILLDHGLFRRVD